MEYGIEYGVKMRNCQCLQDLNRQCCEISPFGKKEEGGGGTRIRPSPLSPVRRKTLGANPHKVVFSQGPQAYLSYYGSREGQFPRWRSAVRVRSEGSAVKAPQ